MHSRIGPHTTVIPPVLLVLGTLLCGAALGAPGGETWILVTENGPVKAANVLPGKDGASLTAVGLSGKRKEIPLASCLGLMRRMKGRPEYGRDHDSRAGIELHSGDTILATDVAYKGNTLTARHPFW